MSSLEYENNDNAPRKGLLKRIPKILIAPKKSTIKPSRSFQLKNKISSSFENIKNSFRFSSKSRSPSIDTIPISNNISINTPVLISPLDTNVLPTADFQKPDFGSPSTTGIELKTDQVAQLNARSNSIQNISYNFPYFHSISQGKAVRLEINTKLDSFITRDNNTFDLPEFWKPKYTLAGKLYFYNIVTNVSFFDIADVWKEEESTLNFIEKNKINRKKQKAFLNAVLLNLQSRDNLSNNMDVLAISANPLSKNVSTVDELSYLVEQESSNKGPVSPEILSASVTLAIHRLNLAISNKQKSKFIECAEAINESIMQIMARMHNNADDPSKKSFIRAYHRQIINSGCDLLLTATIAGSIWPPPDSNLKLFENAKALMSLVHRFLLESEDGQLQGLRSRTLSSSVSLSDKRRFYDTSKCLSGTDQDPMSPNSNFTNLGINTSGLNFFHILKGCKSLDFFHINAKRYIHPSANNRLSSEQEAAKQRLKRYLSTIQGDQRAASLTRRSESASNLYQTRTHHTDVLNVSTSSSDNPEFQKIMNLMLLTFAKIEDECRNLAKLFLIFESAVKKFAKALLEVSNHGTFRENPLDIKIIKSESAKKKDMDSISKLLDCTKLVSSKCYPVVSGIGNLLKEINVIEQICNFCGVNDELVSLTEALSFRERIPSVFSNLSPQAAMVGSSGESSGDSTANQLMRSFKEAQKSVINGSIELVTTAQDLAFLLPQIVYYNEITKVSTGSSRADKDNLIDYNYGIQNVDKNHSIFYTTVPIHPLKESGDADKQQSRLGPESTLSSQNTDTLTSLKFSETFDELYDLRNREKNFKNLALPIKKEIKDPLAEDKTYQLKYKETLTLMATNLKKMVELINNLDGRCLSLMTLSKLELNDCNQKIINVFYQYLVSGRFLPAQSSNRKKKDSSEQIFKPLEEKVEEKGFKSIPIVPNYSDPTKHESPMLQSITSETRNGSKIFKKFSFGNSFVLSSSKKHKFKKNSFTEGTSSYTHDPSFSNSFRMLDDTNRDSFKYFFSKYSLRKSVNSDSTSASGRSSIQSIFSQYNGSPAPQNYHNSYVISSASTQPWYLQPELSADNLILSLDGSLKAATLPAMIERLTAHDVLDTRFVSSFMLTYHAFTTTPRFFGLLFDRYSISPPIGLRQNEIQLWKERKLDPVRLRIFNLLKSWLREHFYPMIEGDIDALEMLRVFACTVMADSQPTLAEKLVKMIESHTTYLDAIGNSRKSEQSLQAGGGSLASTIGPNSLSSMLGMPQNESKIDNTLYKSFSLGRLSVRRFAGNFLISPPPPILPNGQLNSNTPLGKIDPVELARQITIIDYNLLALVRPIEFLKKAWSVSLVDPKAINGLNVEVATNLRSISVLSTRITHFVTAKILSERVIENRVGMLSYFISLAEQLWTLSNYSSLVSVIGGIQSTPVQRLTETWKMLPVKSFNAFESIKSMMKSSRNYIAYREAIQKASPPSIPFVGLALTDLTFIEDGNPDYYGDSKDMINFNKYTQTADIIRQIQEFQDVPYSFVQVNEIISYFFNGLKSSVPRASYTDNLTDVFLKMSQEIEPN